MPKLPDPWAARRTARSASGIARQGPIDTSGYQKLAQVGIRTGSEMKQREDAYAYSRAQTILLEKQTTLINSLNDADYETYQDRYEEGMGPILEEAKEGLSAREAERFGLDAGKLASRGRIILQERGMQKQKEFELGQMIEDDAKGLETFLSAPNEMKGDIITNAMSRIDGLVMRGTLDPTTAASRKQALQRNWGIAYAKTLSPDELESFLETPQADLVPADVRGQLAVQAKEHRARAEAQVATDQIMTLPMEKRIAFARKNLSGQKRDDVVARLKVRNAEEEAAMQEIRANTFDAAHRHVLDGGRVDDIPQSEVDKLKSTDIDALMKTEAALAKGEKITTDWAVFTQLASLTEDELKAINPMDYRGSLSDKHYEDLVLDHVAVKNHDPIEFSHWTTKAQIRTNAMNEAGIEKDTDRAIAFDRYMSEQIQALEAQKARTDPENYKATMQELQAIADEAITKTVTHDGWLWDTESEPLFEMDEVGEIPEQAKRQIAEGLRKKNIEASEQNILRAYHNIRHGRPFNG